MRQNASLVVSYTICTTHPLERNRHRSYIDVNQETRLGKLLVVYVGTENEERIHLTNASSVMTMTKIAN